MNFEDQDHGNYSNYSNNRCRCTPCKNAWAAKMKELRAERRKGPVLGEHGKYSTYNNWGCKCRPCMDAHNENNRRNAANRRERKEGTS